MIPMANVDYMENMMRFHLNPGESVIVNLSDKEDSVTWTSTTIYIAINH